jgi:hypothetical protein
LPSRALYKIDPLKFFAGYEHIQFANPTTPLGAGFTDIGGYTLAFVTNNAYVNDKILQVYWAGVRYTVIPNLDLTAAYYGYQQNAYGTGKVAGCTTSANAACSGSFEAYSFDADYHFNRHFDAYAGAMYSGVSMTVLQAAMPSIRPTSIRRSVSAINFRAARPGACRSAGLSGLWGRMAGASARACSNRRTARHPIVRAASALLGAP